jgi:hypothetical protein
MRASLDYNRGDNLNEKRLVKKKSYIAFHQTKYINTQEKNKFIK